MCRTHTKVSAKYSYFLDDFMDWCQRFYWVQLCEVNTISLIKLILSAINYAKELPRIWHACSTWKWCCDKNIGYPWMFVMSCSTIVSLQCLVLLYHHSQKQKRNENARIDIWWKSLVADCCDQINLHHAKQRFS